MSGLFALCLSGLRVGTPPSLGTLLSNTISTHNLSEVNHQNLQVHLSRSPWMVTHLMKYQAYLSFRSLQEVLPSELWLTSYLPQDSETLSFNARVMGIQCEGAHNCVLSLSLSLSLQPAKLGMHSPDQWPGLCIPIVLLFLTPCRKIPNSPARIDLDLAGTARNLCISRWTLQRVKEYDFPILASELQLICIGIGTLDKRPQTNMSKKVCSDSELRLAHSPWLWLSKALIDPVFRPYDVWNSCVGNLPGRACCLSFA